MSSTNEIVQPGHITTGNVLEDLGFSPEEIREMEMQHDLFVPIRAEIEARKLTQAQVAKILQIHQPDASLLLRGQLSRFSISRLMQFADRLQLAVTINVTPKAESVKPKQATRIPLRRTELRKQPARPLATPRVARKAALA
jgi:predicted XRE-type DNA-binding protein